MSILIILILFLTSTSISLVQSESSHKIVNGFIADRENFPYQVALMLKIKNQEDLSLCGGSIIDSNVILTAGHCLWNVERLVLILGVFDLLVNETDAVQIALNSENFIIHPKFSFFYAYMDVGLITIPEAIKFNRLIQPVSLPTSFMFDESFAGEIGTIAGYGRYCDSCGSSSILRYTKNRIISNDECSTFAGLFPSSTQLCVSTAVNKSSACRGDSGGALTILRNNLTVQVGISSFGAMMCEDGRPAVFTRLTKEIVDWIWAEVEKVHEKLRKII
ncbi:brachyurin-like [Chironomus tepperi]|uniref:brachyurin-like n=1 Tax=Chironomus tepperi TaxID=113505 RepID=UPI00391F7D40